MRESLDAEAPLLRKALRLDRYAEILAHVLHFGSAQTEAVVARFGLTLERWRAVDRAWTEALALAANDEQQPPERALQLSAVLHGHRQRLARLRPSLASIGEGSAKPAVETPAPAAITPPAGGVPSFMLPGAQRSSDASPWAARAIPSAPLAPTPAKAPAPKTLP